MEEAEDLTTTPAPSNDRRPLGPGRASLPADFVTNYLSYASRVCLVKLVSVDPGIRDAPRSFLRCASCHADTEPVEPGVEFPWSSQQSQQAHPGPSNPSILDSLSPKSAETRRRFLRAADVRFKWAFESHARMKARLRAHDLGFALFWP